MQSPPTRPAAKLPDVRIVGFTGHRHLKAPDLVGEALRVELEALQKKGGEIIAVSSVAIGADTLFAREVLRAGIKWIVILPMAKELFREDFTPEDWAAAESLMAHAAEVRVLHGNERPQVYVDCGKATVDESDSLIAVWDGEPATGPGGTAEIVAYARMLGRNVTLLREGEKGVEKIDSTPRPAAEYEVPALLKLIGPPAALPPPPQGLVDHFRTADDLATETAPDFRSKNLRMAGFHLAATLTAGLSLAMHANDFPFPPIILSALKVVFVSAALWILISLRRTHAHEKWLNHRLQAEYCRSILATWHCRDLVEPVSFHEVPELRELAQSALFLRLEKREPVDIKAFRSAYAHERVMKQWNYFRDEADKAEAKAGPLHTRYWIYTFAAVAFSVILLILRFHDPLFATDRVAAASSSFLAQVGMVLLDVAPLAFPAMASFTLACMAIEDVDRRIGRFRDLQNKLRLTLVDLSYCGSWESLTRSVNRTEKILFNEVLEWYSLSRYSAAD